MTDIEKMFIEHPEWKPHFYDNKGISPKDKGYASMMTLAEMFVDFMDLVMVLKFTTSHAPQVAQRYWEGWESYFRFIYSQSPLVRSYWLEHHDWYSQDVHDLLGVPANTASP